MSKAVGLMDEIRRACRLVWISDFMGERGRI